MVGQGDPRTEIVRVAQESKADLIAVGARGLGAVARLFLGCVSRSVVHCSTAPVLVAQGQGVARKNGLRVLVACESLQTGKTAAQYLQRLSWPAGSTCIVLNAVPSVLGGAIPDWLGSVKRSAEIEELTRAWAEEEKNTLAEAKRQMESVAKVLPDELQDAVVEVKRGRPSEEIVTAAKEQSSDLIIIGSKASTPMGRFFVGSTCEAVLNRAPCSVLVIPHQANHVDG